MNFYGLTFFVCLFLVSHFSKAYNTNFCLLTGDSIVYVNETNAMPDFSLTADSIDTIPKHKKLTAAILSFPLPFGILGLHRIYLGTKPYVPFFYIGTLGGCLGILPLIDFICIVSSGKDKLGRFENCPGVFMWSH
jgi:TM2 domain-containing membrane protein YozV